jgi:myosin-1
MLAMSGCTEVKGMSDDDEYTVLTHAMDLVGFSKDEQVDVFKLVSAILMLQNISFAAGVPAGKAAPTAEKGGSQTALAAAAALLGLDPAKLEAALTHRTIVSGANERICNPLESPEEANETARALAKAAYSRLFSRVIERINTAIKPPSGSELAMGVLDIYGFEIFELNSFEQLCINYCNEKLQQFFIALTLKAEQEEYAAEGIAWEAVEYFDNKLVCDLIEAKKPAGVLAYLDEESVMPQASDKTFYEKAAKNLSKHAHFAVPDAKDVALTKAVELSFTIKHYAGDVTYSAKGLLTKNRDDLFLDLIEAGGASRSPFIVSLFPESKERAGTRKRPPTASTQFRASMSDLVNKLVSCSPHYIRTIKPNDEKKAGVFTVDRVAHQARRAAALAQRHARAPASHCARPSEASEEPRPVLRPSAHRLRSWCAGALPRPARERACAPRRLRLPPAV